MVIVACSVAGGLLVFTLLLLSVYIVKSKHSVASFTFPEVVSSGRFTEYASNLLKSLKSKPEVNNREGPSGPGSACSISYQCDINCEESRTSVVNFGLSLPPSYFAENCSEEDGRSTANKTGQAFDVLQIPSECPSRRSSLQQLSEEPYHLSLRSAEFDTETIAMSVKSDVSDNEYEECEVSSTDPPSMRPSLTVATGERKRQAVSTKGNKTVQKYDVLQKPSAAQHHLSGSQHLLEDPYHLSFRSAEFDTETIALSVKSDVSDDENDECEVSSRDPPSMRPSLTVATGERKRQEVSAKGNETVQKYDVLQNPSEAQIHLSGSQQLLQEPPYTSVRSAEFETETTAMSMKSSLSEEARQERREKKMADYILTCQEAMQMTSVKPECEPSSTESSPMHPSLMAVTRERQVQVDSAKGEAGSDKIIVPK